MDSKKTYHHIPNIRPWVGSNPLSGLFPTMIMLTILPLVSVWLALIIAVSLWVVLLVLRKVAWAKPDYMPTLLTSGVVLLLVGLIYYFIPWLIPSSFYSQIVILTISAIVTHFLKMRLDGKEERPTSQKIDEKVLHRRLLINEHRNQSAHIDLFVVLSLFAAGLLSLLNISPDHLAHRICSWIIVAFTWMFYLIEVLNLYWIRKKLLDEEWVSLVDRQGNAVGRVSRSEVNQVQGAQLPMVRLVAICKDMIYLEHRLCCDLCHYECVDTPFIDWVKESENPQMVAQRLIDERFCGLKRSCPRHLITYQNKHGNNSCLVNLYAVSVEEPDLLITHCNPAEGKWWPVQQICELLEGNTFSRLLCNELPYLEQTILLAERIRERKQEFGCGD